MSVSGFGAVSGMSLHGKIFVAHVSPSRGLDADSPNLDIASRGVVSRSGVEGFGRISERSRSCLGCASSFIAVGRPLWAAHQPSIDAAAARNGGKCGRSRCQRVLPLQQHFREALAFCQPLFRLHHTTRLPTTRKWPRTERVHRPHTICFEASILLQRPSFGAGSVSTSQGGKFWRKCFPSGIRQPSPRRDTPRASWR